MSKREPKVGLDSQCLSYLLDAINGIGEPTDELADERKALIRVWFYTPGTFYLSETVVAECGRIRNISRRELHESFVQVLFLDPPVQYRVLVGSRVSALLAIHPMANDCRVLAEAEDLELDALLTYDKTFLQRLAPASLTVALVTPAVYWARLGIPKGARPETVPHNRNPLSKESWWRW
ncbi:MAG: type II toxin-antitoxin system VapC family toxin [Pseudomonadota bacterium]